MPIAQEGPQQTLQQERTLMKQAGLSDAAVEKAIDYMKKVPESEKNRYNIGFVGATMTTGQDKTVDALGLVMWRFGNKPDARNFAFDAASDTFRFIPDPAMGSEVARDLIRLDSMHVDPRSTEVIGASKHISELARTKDTAGLAKYLGELGRELDFMETERR